MDSEDPTWNLRHAELQELVTNRSNDQEIHGPRFMDRYQTDN